MGRPRPLALLTHLLFKTGHVHAETGLFHNLFRQLHGEAVGIVEAEGVGAGDLFRLLMRRQQAVDNLQPRLEGLLESALFEPDGLEDEIAAPGKIGVDLAHLRDGHPGHLGQEGLVQPQPHPVEGGPAQQPPQHVAPPLVGGVHAVGDEKGQGAAVLGHHPQGGVVLGVGAVLLAGESGDFLQQGGENIGVIDVIGARHDHDDSLQPHAGIDVGVGQGGTLARLVLVILGKDQVPYLLEAPALAVGPAVRLAAAGCFAEIVVNLAAGPARPGRARRPPEVVLLAAADNLCLRHADIPPVAEGLVVVEINSNPEFLGLQLHAFREELPGPGDGLLLEVVAHAEVAQHLEEGEVDGVADGLDIGSAEALLARGQAAAGGPGLPQEIGFYLHHARRRQEQGRVALGYQGGRGDDLVPLLLEEFQKGGAYFVAVHKMAPGNRNYLPVILGLKGGGCQRGVESQGQLY